MRQHRDSSRSRNAITLDSDCAPDVTDTELPCSNGLDGTTCRNLGVISATGAGPAAAFSALLRALYLA